MEGLLIYAAICAKCSDDGQLTRQNIPKVIRLYFIVRKGMHVINFP